MRSLQDCYTRNRTRATPVQGFNARGILFRRLLAVFMFLVFETGTALRTFASPLAHRADNAFLHFMPRFKGMARCAANIFQTLNAPTGALRTRVR